MKVQPISKQNFDGKLLIVDKFGKKPSTEIQKSILAQLGSTVCDLKHLIAPKPFDLFVSRRPIDYIDISANKTFAGAARGETTVYSLHKSTLNQIVQIAKSSIEEYEKYIQKHV